jgi:hypothetical protein
MKTIKYYENTKYTLKKGKKKFRAIEMHRKWNIDAECECIAKLMVTFLKFPLANSMKFIKIYSIK